MKRRPLLVVAVSFLTFVLCAPFAEAQALRSADAETRDTESVSQAPFSDVLQGEWNYYSFVLDRLAGNTDTTKPLDDYLFGYGVLTINSVENGRFRGTLDFGPNFLMEMKGSVTYGDPPTLQFRGAGTTSGSADWVYDYKAHYVLEWPNGVNQRASIIGTVIRAEPHSNGAARPGVVASWIAVKRDSASNAAKRLATEATPRVPQPEADSTEHPGANAPSSELQKAWYEFYKGATPENAPPKPDPEQAPRTQNDGALLPPPQQSRLALESQAAFVEPDVIRPETDEKSQTTNVLETTLLVQYGDNQIGNDRVHLRSYNGDLVGPTLRVKPGDTLRVKLKNDLPPNTNPPISGHNGHHHWNTTNLHTHGLHVSPAANGDNVLLEIGPGGSFEYEIAIPEDHPAGTFWYHGHKHGAVAAQVASGMSGALIIEGGLDEIPEIKDAKERLFIFQQIPYYNDEDHLPVGVIEPEFAVNFFGPGAWRDLKRFTTINGQVQPLISMQPGEVQRWRFIDSGFREKLALELQAADDSGPKIDFHEIAVDGLALGKVIPTKHLELFPGYRSDVLIQAPAEPGTYLLVDEQSSAEDSLLSQPEEKKYLARVVVDGEAMPMRLPEGESLERLKLLRLPSVTDEEIDPNRPPQQVTYGIRADEEGNLLFTINNRPYDPTRPRLLHVGGAEEWIATSFNPGVNVPVNHPFHIHTNPFEVISIVDRNGEETLKNGPVWRDTIILMDGERVKMRTRYERYIGDFVQHCHILDHEDQGMMELVRIAPSSGPHTDRSGAETNADAAAEANLALPVSGKPSVLVFLTSVECPHCNEQMQRFAFYEKEFRRLGVDVVFVSVASSPGDEANSGFPFRIVADPQHTLFRKFGCYWDRPRHGTIVIDGEGVVRMKRIGDAPWMDIAAVIREVSRWTDASAPRESHVDTTKSETLIRHNPDAIHPPFGDLYSHGVEIRPGARLLYIAGQAGVSPEGEVPSDPARQLDIAWENIKAVLAAADMGTDNLVKVNCYIKDGDASYLEAYAESVRRHLGGKPAMTAPVVKRLWSSSWYYEIDAVAAK